VTFDRDPGRRDGGRRGPRSAPVAWAELLDWLTQTMRREVFLRALPSMFDEADHLAAPVGLALIDVEGLDVVSDFADTSGADEALVLAAHRIRMALPPWALLGRMLPRELGVALVLEERDPVQALRDALVAAVSAVALRPVMAVDDGALTIAARAVGTVRGPGGQAPEDLLVALDELRRAAPPGRTPWSAPVNTVQLLGDRAPMRVQGLPHPDVYHPAELRRMRTYRR